MERKYPEVFSGCAFMKGPTLALRHRSIPPHDRPISGPCLKSRGVDTISGLGLYIDLGFYITAWLLALLPSASLGALLPTAPAYLHP